MEKDTCIWREKCSTDCEMGIDVCASAMANLDVKCAPGVGCGLCGGFVVSNQVRPSGIADRLRKLDAAG